ncbi:hypothetical protein [Glutamicibacter sp. 0426]|uniref:hypothetical protein n=1 Tax=Glutamicibacter sp. 0426 TaxID=1913445 RepID=UPI00093F661B|nr:hypothetical protein [Glutamicibacter sp. 0426]
MRFIFGNIQADEEGYYWLLNGVERRDRNDSFDILEDDLKDISATHLRQMYRGLQKHLGEDYSPSDMVIHEGGVPSDFDLRDLPILPHTGVKFIFEEGEILLAIECFLSLPSYDNESHQIGLNKLNASPPGLNVAELITPPLGRKRLSFLNFDTYSYSDDVWRLAVAIGFNPRSRMLTDLYRDALEIKALIEASSGGVTHETVTELIRGGHVKALLGQPEGDWLEAKRQHADLDSEVGKIRLAQWVAQFANSPEGGVVVLGLSTKNQGNGDVITKITPLPRVPGIRRKYVQVLDNKVIPPIENLAVEVIAHGESDLVLIEVPPQNEENKPFLVHGAVVEGKAQGNFFSIVRRRNDEMASTHPANVHANLTVGRAFLRRGELPRS